MLPSKKSILLLAVLVTWCGSLLKPGGALATSENFMVPQELVFKVAFLGLEGRGNRAAFLDPNPTSPNQSQGDQVLQHFFQAADRESIQLTLNANGVQSSRSHTDPQIRSQIFRLLRKTRKADILAIAPSITKKEWQFLWGSAEDPITQNGPEDLESSASSAVGTAAVRSLLTSMGFNSLIFPKSQTQALVVALGSGNFARTQALAFAPEPGRTDAQTLRSKVRSPEEQKITAILEIVNQRSDGLYEANVVVSKPSEWSANKTLRGFVTTDSTLGR